MVLPSLVKWGGGGGGGEAEQSYSHCHTVTTSTRTHGPRSVPDSERANEHLLLRS